MNPGVAIIMRLEFFFQETSLNIRRHALMSLAAIGTVAASLVVVGAALLLACNFNFWIQQVASEVQINVYLDRQLTGKQAQTLFSTIVDLPSVKSATFVPREEGFERLRRSLNLDPELLNIKNPLPDAIEVQAQDPNQVPVLAETLQELKGVKDVVYPTQLTEKILTIQHIVQVGSWVAILLVALATLIIVHNTIRLTIFARRREISIMQTVGATNCFVMVPFLMEGTFHGLVGASIACTILLVGYGYLLRLISNSFPLFQLVTERSTLINLTLVILASGIILGLLGSMVSTLRFLRDTPNP